MNTIVGLSNAYAAMFLAAIILGARMSDALAFGWVGVCIYMSALNFVLAREQCTKN